MKVIHLLRKACSESTVATNVVRHGTGGINVDATRVATSTGDEVSTHSRSPEASKKENRPVYGVYGPTITAQTEGQKLGRWPANMLLQHLDGCVQDGTRSVGSGDRRINEGDEFYNSVHEGYNRPNRSSYTHNIAGQVRTYGTEVIAAWDCVEECPIAALDGQGGMTKSSGGRIGNAQGVYSNQGRTGWGTGHVEGDPGFGDEGGVARYFKQFAG